MADEEKKPFMAKEEVSKRSVFEQYWGQSKHLESERMWIMGIWFGMTGFLLKEIWGSNLTGATGIQLVRSMSLAHLMLTFTVLVIVSKLNLEYSRYADNIREMGREVVSENSLKALWARRIPGNRRVDKWARRIFNAILTVGGVSSGILIFAIVFDVTLMTRGGIEDRFVCGFQDWWLFSLIWVVAFVVYQWLYDTAAKKPKAKPKQVELKKK